MSTESVKQFWQKVQNDQQLQARLRAESRTSELVKVAAETGFTFTLQDYEAALKEEMARRHAADELRPEHLSQLAGVVPEDSINSCTTTCCTDCNNRTNAASPSP